MSDFVTIAFTPLAEARRAARRPAAEGGAETLVVFVGADLRPTAAVEDLLGGAAAAIAAGAAAAGFKGKARTALDLLAPAGLGFGRLLVVGTAAKAGAAPDGTEMVSLGGFVMGKLREGARATVALDLPEATPPQAVADFAQGLQLRAYRFDRYKTRKKDDEDRRGPATVTLAVADAAAVRERAAAAAAVADGVELARTLVNEPPNVLYPVEFARRAAELSRLGVEVEILDLPALERLRMGALLGVGQGSAHESRLVVLRWKGGGTGAPVAFVGKGVTFDTGGISIKGAAGMEDMKGDMAGAACVVGLMHALAARKARVDAVGVIGLVENMPDGKAQRPGDIVTSMSGQTIEIINTDAEGRLVLADALWYVQDRFKPRFMIDLATLTGAILVALASEHAGLFSNDDALAERLQAAGRATGEKVWRLPLTPNYDKLIDSKFADMKNTGGRHAGSITAAQFLQRFTNDTPWVHLDIAGTGMGAPSDDINQSWGSGWGVRLLDRLVADHYEG